MNGYRNELLRSNNRTHYPVLYTLVTIAGYISMEKAINDKWTKLKKKLIITLNN